MKRVISVSLLIVSIFIFGSGAFSSRPAVARADWRSSRIIVRLSSGLSISAIQNKYNLSTARVSYGFNSYLLDIPSGSDSASLIKSITTESGVLYAEQNGNMTTPMSAQRQPVSFPGDIITTVGSGSSVYASQQLASFFQLSSVRSISQGQGVKVAVIDTGIDMFHPALAANIAPGGYDYVGDDNIPYDEAGGASCGHGTFVAGLILLVAPKAQILPIRVLDAQGNGTAFDVAEAIRYAADKGARVINLSLGTNEKPQLVVDAINYAVGKNCLIVAAAGNSNLGGTPMFPANDSDVLGVAATDFLDRKASFSNYGSGIDYSAPGVGLISAVPGGQYAQWSGTSFSAALVSAEAALLFSAAPYFKDDASDIKYVMNSWGAAAYINTSLWGQLGKGRIIPLKAVQNQSASSSYGGH